MEVFVSVNRQQNFGEGCLGADFAAASREILLQPAASGSGPGFHLRTSEGTSHSRQIIGSAHTVTV